MAHFLQRNILLSSFFLISFFNYSQGGFSPSYVQTKKEAEKFFSLDQPFQDLKKKGEKISSRYEEVLLREPYNPFSQFVLGQLYQTKGEKSKARFHYQMASRQEDSNPTYHFLLATLFERRKLKSFAHQEYIHTYQIMLDQGIESSPLFALTLLYMGEENLKQKRTVEAETKISLATQMNPTSLDSHWALFKLLLKGYRPEVIPQFLSNLKLFINDFENQHILLLNIYLYLIGVILFTIFFSILSFFLRHLSQIHHQVKELLPKAIPPSSQAIIATLLLVSPLFWRIGPSLLLPLFIIITWFFLTKKERRLLSLLLLLLIALPFILNWSRSLLEVLEPKNPIHLLATAQKSGWDERLAKDLQETLLLYPNDPYLLLSLGLIEKKRGNFSLARENYKKALLLKESQALIHNNLGNIYFAQGKWDSALGEYNLALKLQPNSAKTHYNLGQAYLKQLCFSKATRELELALRLDFDLIQFYSLRSRDHYNRVVIDEKIGAKKLWMRILKEGKGEKIQKGLLPRVTRLDFPASFGYSFFLFLLLFTLQIFVRKSTPSLICPACGRVFCPRCRLTANPDFCRRCAEKMGMDMDSGLRESIFAKLREESKRHSKAKLFLITLILPGAGHFYLQAPFRGIFFLALTSLFLLLFHFRGLIIEPIPTSTFFISTSTKFYLGGTFVLLLYLSAFFSLFRLVSKKIMA